MDLAPAIADRAQSFCQQPRCVALHSWPYRALELLYTCDLHLTARNLAAEAEFCKIHGIAHASNDSITQDVDAQQVVLKQCMLVYHARLVTSNVHRQDSEIPQHGRTLFAAIDGKTYTRIEHETITREAGEYGWESSE